MQRRLHFPSLKCSKLDVATEFNVVIAYEDFETGTLAMKTYDYLVEHLGQDCLFTNQMWKFEVLAVPKLREMAVKDASAADVILVAAHGTNPLPDEVKAWTELWLSEGSGAIALVGLFAEGDACIETPTRIYLADVARRGKMEFFSQPGAWPSQYKDEHFGAGDGDRNGKALSLLAGAVQETTDVAHWGINE